MLFSKLFAATRLQVNFPKTVIIPLWDSGFSDVRYWVVDRAPQILDSKIASFATYLGVVVGPEADDNRWTKIGSKFWARTVLARSGGAGFFSSLRRYRTYAYSVLSYIAQFSTPSKSMVTLEAKTAQQLTAGPWNANLADTLQNLRR